MAIVLDATSLSEIVSYDGLVLAIQQWLDREDLDDRVPYFIRLAEAQFNRTIWSPEREAIVTYPAAAVMPLPTDLHELRSVYMDTDPRQPLEQVTPNSLRALYPAQMTGRPLVYSVQAGKMLLGPSPDSAYSVVLDYYQKIPALTQALQSNWLINTHPDVYLFGSLLQAEFFGWNDDRLPVINAKLQEIIEEINANNNRKRYGAAPLRMRHGVSECP